MADPTTPIPNFTLNLEPHIEPISPIEEGKKAESIEAIQIDIPSAPAENSPVIEETQKSTASISLDLPENTINTEETKPEESLNQAENTNTEKQEDDRLKKEDQIVEEAKEEPLQVEIPTETTPIIETPVAMTIDLPEMPSVPETNEVITNTEEIIENPNTVSQPIEDTPVTEVQTEIDTPTEESPVNISPVEGIKKEEVPTQDIQNPESKIQNNPETPIPNEETIPNPGVQIQNNPETPSLSKDMEIIKNIQNTNSVANATPIPTNSPTNNTIDTMPKIPTTNSFNLDDLQVQIPQIPNTNIPAAPIVPPSPIPANPYDNLQNIIPQIAPTAINPNTNNTKNTGKIISTIGTIVFILLVWFVVKTMYPLQYKGFVAGVTGADEDETIATDIGSGGDSMLGSGNILSGDILGEELTGDNTFLGSGDSLLDDTTTTGENIETDTQETTNDSQEEHNAADTSKQKATEEFTTKLQTFSAQGKDALDQAKNSNNKTTMKYALSLYKKAEGYLQELANGQEITSDKMNEIEAELSSYLAKLSPSQSDAEEIPNQTPNTPNNGSDFNPDSFFGNNK